MNEKPADGAQDRRSVLMFVVTMLIFGTIGVFRRYIPFSSGLLACVRGLVGGIFLAVFIRVRRMPGALRGRDLPKIMLTGAMIGVNWILLFEAYNYTSVAVATLCYYMQPTIVTLLSPMIFGEKLTAKKLVCAGISILGMVLVSGVAEEGGLEGGNLTGIALGLGAAAFYSGVVILNKKTPGMDPYRKTTVELLSAGMVMIPYLMMTDGFHVDEFSLTALGLLLIVGIVHTGIAYAMYFGSMEKMSVQSIAVLSYIDPVSALLFSALLLREPLSPGRIAGAALILGAAMVSELSGAGRRKAGAAG